MEKRYTTYSFWITLLVILFLGAAGLIRSFSIGGIFFKRVNIISDLVKFPDDTLAPSRTVQRLDESFLAESEKASNPTQLEEARQMPSPETQRWDFNGITPMEDTPEPDARVTNPAEQVVPIEDFSEGDNPSVSEFCRSLEQTSKKRIVRIAFLGDSYIEGDIITADVREQLQTLFGGRGVGFVPFATPFAANRATIKHTYQAWKSYNLIYKKSAPKELQDHFYVSGLLCVPEEGASVEYEGVGFRKRIKSAAAARLLFVNGGESEVEVVVNDSMRRTFYPATSPLVQQIDLSGGDIQKMKIKIHRPQGFIGYGVVFEGRNGVCVDNYALRSNSGLALFGTSSSVNSQMDHALGYDLIVLQYGLNAMDPHATDYKAYGSQLEKVIRYVQACFPETTILVMGVGDRSTMRDGEPVTMPGVRNMVARQREAAQACGVAFWNTFQAMGGENSMPRFVDRGWAAKDYTHLGYRGGKAIAEELVKALLHAARNSTLPEPAYDSMPNHSVVESEITSDRSELEVEHPEHPEYPERSESTADSVHQQSEDVNYGEQSASMDDQEEYPEEKIDTLMQQ